MNLNINQEVGLLVDGFDTPPYFMMGHRSRYVGQRVEEAGYQPVKDLLAYEMDPNFKIPSVMTAVERRLAGSHGDPPDRPQESRPRPEGDVRRLQRRVGEQLGLRAVHGR